MAEANDIALLREFSGHNSETAFAELVRRHINLVYSVALRFTGNTGDAQDVTQAVFIILARKAAGLSARTVLTGWMYETTRFTASRLLRSRTRRRAHEQEASMQSACLIVPRGRAMKAYWKCAVLQFWFSLSSPVLRDCRRKNGGWDFDGSRSADR